ncbi:MAG TPA: STAS domain-containing protein [Acidimicrobiales bacterium]
MADFAGRAVTTTDDDGGTVTSDANIVTVTGEIDFSTAPRLRRALAEALHARGPETVVDLSAVSFIDASGIGVLMGAVNLAHSEGGQLVLRHPSRPVLFLLDLMELHGVLGIER